MNFPIMLEWLSEMNTNQDNISKNQWFFQIIFPLICCMALIGIGSFFLIGMALNKEINLGMLRDISLIFLILLVLPQGIIISMIMIFFIAINSKIKKLNKESFPGILLIIEKAHKRIVSICETSVRPFFFFGSIFNIFKKK